MNLFSILFHDDFIDIKQNLLGIINRLRDDDYNVAATIFTIIGGQDCCDGGALDCSDLFGVGYGRERLTRKYIHCINSGEPLIVALLFGIR